MAKPPKRIRKNIDIDAVKLAAARRVLGAPTDTATVDQALDDVIFVDELRSAMNRLVAAGGLASIDAGASPARKGRRVAES